MQSKNKMRQQQVSVMVIMLVVMMITCFVNSFIPLKTTPLRPTSQVDPSIPPYTTIYYDQLIDHFDFYPTKPETYKQRVLICDKFWDGNPSSPILFYTGNEGTIETFYNNTGFMFDIAPEFKALLIFAEHRYYGQSMPFGDKSFTRENVRYLSSWQALADYAKLIPDLKKQYKIDPNAPVIALGGSYGGMLAATFRIKYPHIVDGAIASSAPVLQFEGHVSPSIFNEIVTKDYENALPNGKCSDWIQKAFELTQKYAGTASGRDSLKRQFQLCTPLKDLNDGYQLMNFLYAAVSYMAMTDYPYSTSFLQPLPAWPVKASCVEMEKKMSSGPYSDELLLQAFAAVAGVYYNTSGALQCFNISSGDSPNLGDQAWSFQACTEMVLVIGQYGGKTDMFWPAPWNLKDYMKTCYDAWGIEPRPYWYVNYYGTDKLEASSNIIFSNGELDPWRGGGVNKSFSNSVIAIYIEQGAHHLDLRSANSQDPESVKQARRIEVEHIKKWIQK